MFSLCRRYAVKKLLNFKFLLIKDVKFVTLYTIRFLGSPICNKFLKNGKLLRKLVLENWMNGIQEWMVRIKISLHHDTLCM